MNIKPFLHVVLVSLFLPAALSQAAPAAEGGMSEEQMQQMMEQMQKMQACMAGIDQSDMDRLAARAEEEGREIEALCDAGKRDEAQKKAIAYGKEMAASKEMAEMMKCGEMARQMMGEMAVLAQEGGAAQVKHVCDNR